MRNCRAGRRGRQAGPRRRVLFVGFVRWIAIASGARCFWGFVGAGNLAVLLTRCVARVCVLSRGVGSQFLATKRFGFVAGDSCKRRKNRREAESPAHNTGFVLSNSVRVRSSLLVPSPKPLAFQTLLCELCALFVSILPFETQRARRTQSWKVGVLFAKCWSLLAVVGWCRGAIGNGWFWFGCGTPARCCGCRVPTTLLHPSRSVGPISTHIFGQCGWPKVGA